MKRKNGILLLLTIILLYLIFCIKVSVCISGHPQIYFDEYLNNTKFIDIKSRKIGFATKEEIFVNKCGNPQKCFEIDDIEIGDIFITASTHSFGWHHGHAALVVGINPLRTLEAESLGTKSRIVESPLWERYTTFIQLRLKNEYGGKYLAEKAAEYGKNNLVNINYGFLCSKNCKCAIKVNCSYIVWKAYNEAGIDIDSNGGYIVTPRNIYECNYFDKIKRLGI